MLESLFDGEDERDEIFKLCDVVRETAYSIHKYLRHGHLESVYEKALAHRLTKSGHLVQQQIPLPVYDEDGTELGTFYADLFVGYLRSSGIEHGLLINFGSERFQIKKLVLSNQ